jgi:hypothetical protein
MKCVLVKAVVTSLVTGPMATIRDPSVAVATWVETKAVETCDSGVNPAVNPCFRLHPPVYPGPNLPGWGAGFAPHGKPPQSAGPFISRSPRSGGLERSTSLSE